MRNLKDFDLALLVVYGVMSCAPTKGGRSDSDSRVSAVAGPTGSGAGTGQTPTEQPPGRTSELDMIAEGRVIMDDQTPKTSTPKPGDGTSAPGQVGTSDTEVGPGPATGGASNGTKVATDFKKGQPFDAKLLTGSQMITALVASQKYGSVSTPKAIAVNQDGLGMVTVHAQDSTQGDADRSALQACFVIGGGKPCALLASGGTFSVDKAALGNGGTYQFSLSTPRTIAEAPFVAPKELTKYSGPYTAFGGPKALAISLDGTVISVLDRGLGNQVEADRLALERCEMAAKMIPCMLMASGARISFNPTAGGWKLRGSYRAVDLTTRGIVVPGLSAEAIDDLADGIRSYTDRVEDDGTGIVYFTPKTGRYGWATPENNLIAGKDYKASAKDHCEAFDGAGTCIVLVEGLQLALTPQKLGPFVSGFELAHCKAMPRENCEAHKTAGCSGGGNYYIISADGKVSSQACNI